MLSENIISVSLITISMGLTRLYEDEIASEWEKRCKKCLEIAINNGNNSIHWENLRDIDEIERDDTVK